MEGFKNNKFCCYHCSLAESCRTLCNPMDCSTLVSSALHNVLEFVQIHIHWVSDANEPSHPLSPSSPAAFNLSQHQDLFQWVGSSNQVAKVLELQIQHQPIQWIFSFISNLFFHSGSYWSFLFIIDNARVCVDMDLFYHCPYDWKD